MSGLEQPLSGSTAKEASNKPEDISLITSPRSARLEHVDTAVEHSFWADLFLVASPKDVAEHLMNRWTNVGTVAALCAGMAVTMDAIDTSDFESTAEGEFFAAVTGVSFVLSLCSVLGSLVLFAQLNNLFRDEDIRWFIRETEPFHFVPTKLLNASIASQVLGHFLMISMMHEFTATLVVGVVSFVGIGGCYWMYEHLRVKVDTRLLQMVSNMEELSTVFKLIDTKNAGRVTVEKMKKKLTDERISNFIQVEASRIDKVVASVDADGDGWVTWEEFRDHLSNRRTTNAFNDMDLDGNRTLALAPRSAVEVCECLSCFCLCRRWGNLEGRILNILHGR